VEFALLITKLKGNAVILYPNTYYVTLGPPTKPKEKNPAGSRTRRPLWSSRLRSPTSPLHAPHVLHATSPPHNSRPPRTHFTSPPPPTPPPYNRSRAALGDRLVGGRGSMHPLVEALVGERRHWAPALRHAAAWAGTLALAVSVASFAPEAAFVWSLAGGGAGARACPVGSACACRRGWRGGPAPTCSCRRRSRGSPSAPPRASCARSPSGAGTTSTSRPLLERRVPKAAVLVQLFFFSLRNARPWLGVWDVRGAEHVFFFVTRTYLVNLIFIFCTHKTHYGYVNTYDMIKKLCPRSYTTVMLCLSNLHS
jgi:hypothetical protein